MRDEDILESLKKHERDYQVFVLRSEAFIARWSPEDPYQKHRFTADLMGLFREMFITQQQVHAEVAQRYFKQSMDLANLRPSHPVIVSADQEKIR